MTGASTTPGLRRAQDQLSESLAEIRASPAVRGEGLVGDADPILAIDDALYDFPADEILIVTHPEGRARWMEDDLFERASQRFRQPIRHFVVENGSVRAAEASGPGLAEPSQREVEPESRNLPRFSLRDITGIVVAIAGTLVLIVTAASNPDETGSGFDYDALHTIIAGLAAGRSASSRNCRCTGRRPRSWSACYCCSSDRADELQRRPAIANDRQGLSGARQLEQPPDRRSGAEHGPPHPPALCLAVDVEEHPQGGGVHERAPFEVDEQPGCR